MDRIERICSRFPRLYKHWAKDSLLYTIIDAVGRHLDQVEERITGMMKAHWVDTAVEEELDGLGATLGLNRFVEEDDSHFRGRLKRAVNEYKGGGTVSAILEAVRAAVDAEENEDVEIVENPPASTFAEFTVRAGNTWALGSSSIRDEESSLTLTVEEGGEVSDPQVANLDLDESLTFKGKLKGGQELVIKEKEAFLDGEDVSDKILPPKIPHLLRRGSNWKYSEALEKLIGVFDEARFDEHTFALKVPAVTIRFDWTRLQPATFEIRIKSKALSKSGLSKPYLEKIVNSMKATGVRVLMKISG